MASLTITIVVAADPSEKVHSHMQANGADIWEVGPMLKKAITDLQAEFLALPVSHFSRADALAQRTNP